MADNCPVFPVATELPINGLHGSLHEIVFLAPSYRSNLRYNLPPSAPLTWEWIDDYGHYVATSSSIEGICLGMVLITFLYVLLVVPHSKRGKPFHRSLIVALSLELLYRLLRVVQLGSREIGRFPAYRYLTQDMTSAASSSFIAYKVTLLVLGLATITATQVTLLIQASSTLSVLRVTGKPWYTALMAYLITGCTTIVVLTTMSLAFAIQTDADLNISDMFTPLNGKMIRTALRLSMAITICSFCIVSIVAITHTLVARRKVASGPKRRSTSKYDRVLTVMGVVSLQSLVAPAVLVGVQFLPIDVSAGDMVVPVLLSVMPFGGLFGLDKDSKEQFQAAPGVLDDVGVANCRSLSNGVGRGTGSNVQLMSLSRVNDVAPSGFVDRELDAIDRL